MRKRGRRFGGVRPIMATAAAAIMGILVLAGPSRAQDYRPSAIHFQAFADELLAGIRASDVADIPAIGGYGKPRIAVLPFAEDEDAVSKRVAGEFNARLLAALTRQGNRDFRFVARDALKPLIRGIDAIGELEPGADDRVADLLRNARVDILVVGRLRKTGDGVVLSYKAVSTEDGTLFAATAPRRLPRARGVMVATAPRPAPAPAPVAAPIPVHTTGGLEAGMEGRPTVAEAQRLLIARGYDPGPVDGMVRPKMRDALRAFQRSAGLAVNGRMTREVVKRLGYRNALR